jgi:hypothetical protein
MKVNWGYLQFGKGDNGGKTLGLPRLSVATCKFLKLQHFWAITKKCEIIGKFQICQVWN